MGIFFSILDFILKKVSEFEKYAILEGKNCFSMQLNILAMN